MTFVFSGFFFFFFNLQRYFINAKKSKQTIANGVLSGVDLISTTRQFSLHVLSCVCFICFCLCGFFCFVFCLCVWLFFVLFLIIIIYLLYCLFYILLHGGLKVQCLGL